MWEKRFAGGSSRDRKRSLQWPGANETFNRFYLNSAGALRQEARSYASLYLYSKTEEDGRKPRSAGAVRVNHGLKVLDVDGCLKEAAEKTISHLNYDKIKSGKYRVVFSGEAFLSLLGAFSNMYNAQSILDKRSLSTPESPRNHRGIAPAVGD